MRTLRHLVPLALILALPCAAGAQDSTTAPAWKVDVGSRVLLDLSREGTDVERVYWMKLPPRIVGRVAQVTSDSLYVQLHPGVSAAAVPRGAVQRMYVSAGRPRGYSMFRGAALGAAWGLTIGQFVYSDRILHEGTDRGRLNVYGEYAATGALAGVLLGAVWPDERWRRVR